MPLNLKLPEIIQVNQSSKIDEKVTIVYQLQAHEYNNCKRVPLTLDGSKEGQLISDTSKLIIIDNFGFYSRTIVAIEQAVN